MHQLALLLMVSCVSLAFAATPISLTSEGAEGTAGKQPDSRGMPGGENPADATTKEQAAMDAVKDDGGGKRKKILDLVRLGVVMIETKTYASTESEKNSASAGTGFIVDKEMGLIATNRHVVGDMTVSTYTIKFSNGTRTPAQLVYFDPLYDFAFVKVDPTKLPKDAMGLELSKTRVQVNEGIYCMGNSGRDEFSTFRGTIFSIYENLGPFSEQSFSFSGLTIPGASGSPVFDEEGRVIGVVYGGKFSSGSALPISYVVDALKSIKNKKLPEHRSLGIVPSYVSLEDMAKAELLPVEAMQKYLNEFPNSNNKILMINSRISGTEARTAFQAGDLLWSVNKKLVGPNLYDFDVMINDSGDKEVAVEVYRDGKLVEVKLKSYPLTLDYAWNMVTFMDATWVANNEFVRLFTGYDQEGVFVLGFGPTSPLREITGQLPGFFMDTRLMKITEIDGKPLKTLQDLITIIPGLSNKREIKIKYLDFMGMVGLGTFSPADRQERLSVVTYESKFDSPKFYKFDVTANEWQATDIVIKMGNKAALTPTTKQVPGMSLAAPSKASAAKVISPEEAKKMLDEAKKESAKGDEKKGEEKKVEDKKEPETKEEKSSEKKDEKKPEEKPKDDKSKDDKSKEEKANDKKTEDKKSDGKKAEEKPSLAKSIPVKKEQEKEKSDEVRKTSL